MSEKSLSRARCALCAALWFGVGGTARADTLILMDSALFGRVVSVGPNEVRFAVGCAGIRAIPRAEVRALERNTSCAPRAVRPYSAGGGICAGSRTLYELELNGIPQRIFAADYQMDANRLHFVNPDESRAYHGPSRSLVSASRRRTCPQEVAEPPPLPNFCVEARQWAVNFNYDPLFPNRILTRGVSFFLEDDSGRPMPDDAPIGEVIRSAFGSAILYWMGALQDRLGQLPDEARTVVRSMISSSSNGYSMLVAPQVIRVGCPDTATFIVRYVTRNEGMFLGNGITIPRAARAQVEGRTIFINGTTFPCWRAELRPVLSLGPDPSGRECFNLIPVLTHEVGHALGLAGHADTGTASIMDSVIGEALAPTTEDADSLVRVLLRPIQGLPAGRMDADGRGVGLRVRPAPRTDPVPE